MRRIIAGIMMMIGVAYAEISKVDPSEFESMGAYSVFRAETYEEVRSLIGDYVMEFLTVYGSDSDINDAGYCVIYVEPAEVNSVVYNGFVLTKEKGQPFVRFYGLRKPSF